jgi:hypothetical protein
MGRNETIRHSHKLKGSIKIVICLALAACTRRVPVQLPTTELELYTYAQGSVVSHCQIGVHDTRRKILEDWLSANVEGWKPTAVTYVPGVYLSGTGFAINFLGKEAILNYDGGQFARAVEPTAYAAFSCSGV